MKLLRQDSIRRSHLVTVVLGGGVPPKCKTQPTLKVSVAAADAGGSHDRGTIGDTVVARTGEFTKVLNSKVRFERFCENAGAASLLAALQDSFRDMSTALSTVRHLVPNVSQTGTP